MTASLGYEVVRVAVTGGAGFIGSHVADALVARGDDVTVVDSLASGRRENVPAGARFEQLDIRDDAIADALEGVELVFHLAAQADVVTSVARPDYDADVNVRGTVRVLQAAPGAQVIFSSTGGAMYGECSRPAREDDPRQPISPYGAAKLAAEEYLSMWNRLHGTRHVSLRFANVYGPRQAAGLEGGVVAIFLDRMAAGEETFVYGDGLQTRDFVYVGDVVASMLAAAGGAGGVYNVGTGVAVSVADLHAACSDVSGYDRPPTLAEARRGDLRHSVLDPSKAERELGWRAERTLEDGLRLTWESIGRS
jgi:UDP-glucose 4-epimerase